MTSSYSDDEIAQLGDAIYQRDIRGSVEPAHNGEFLVIDVSSGRYALGKTALEAAEQLQPRSPDAPLYIARVGRPTAYKIGSNTPAAPQ